MDDIESSWDNRRFTLSNENSMKGSILDQMPDIRRHILFHALLFGQCF